MIKSFADKRTAKIFERKSVSRMSNELQNKVLYTLELLDAADSLSDIAARPGNRLEKLRGDRKGQYSIRVNEQWRICFTWSDGVAYSVEAVDYH